MGSFLPMDTRARNRDKEKGPDGGRLMMQQLMCDPVNNSCPKLSAFGGIFKYKDQHITLQTGIRSLFEVHLADCVAGN